MTTVRSWTTRTFTLPSPEKKALIYAGLGFLVGILTFLMQALIAFSLSPATDLKTWGISVLVGAGAAGIARALPYLEAVLPARDA
jgi:hypothetical protein